MQIFVYFLNVLSIFQNICMFFEYSSTIFLTMLKKKIQYSFNILSIF